jgi:PAS domain S-box-containing protein
MNDGIQHRTGGEPPASPAEQDYRALVASLQQLIWTAAPDGTIGYLGEQWTKFTGIPMQDLRQTRRETLVHPDDRQRLLEAWDTGRRAQTEIELRLRLRHASGLWRWQLSRDVPVRDAQGSVIRWIGTLTDIHDQVLAEQDAVLLDEVGECCRRATAEADLMWAVAERIGRCLEVDHCLFGELDAVGKVGHVRHDFHTGPRSLVGTYPLDRFGAWTVDSTLAGDTSVVADAATDERTASHFEEGFSPLGVRAFIIAPLSGERELRGTFVVLCSRAREWTRREAHLVKTAGERAWLAVQRLRDSVARKERESELTAARNEAERLRLTAETANRMKDEFLATVSHELRAPLNAIGGWAGVLRVGKLDTVGIAKAASVIEKNVRAQAKMIEDLLDISRIVSGRLRLESRSFDPAVSVEGAIESLRPAATAKDIRLEHTKSTAARSISGDPNRLQQAVWNLISNAVKFTDPGGHVLVSLSQQEGAVEIAVSDTGIGIAPDFLPHIFKRFQQANGSHQRRFGGLGLGLAIVRHIVELHGGSVEARSAGEGRGATFVIRIPLDNEVRTVSPPSSAPSASRAQVRGSIEKLRDSLAGLRLLTVDDEADASEMLKAALEQYGARVTTVASAAAALDILAREVFDVLVSDIGMPGMNGYELLERIRAGHVRDRRIPAIAVTGYARSEDRERAFRAGYKAHVVKPIEPEELAATVRAAAETSGQEQ